MTKTTLTREALRERLKEKAKCTPVDVPGWGTVLIREQSELKRTGREARLYDDKGELILDAYAKRRVHKIIDCVMHDEETPAFTSDDIDALAEMAGSKLDALYAACLSVEEKPKKTSQSSSGSND